ncbi:MAG TPA: cellulase family glycosylhydrolase [Flavisolibacter sp.]|jgi:hypothetical protein
MKKALPCLLLFLSLQCFAQGFLRVQGKTIVNGKGEEVLLRGMGLGGWMLQEPYMLQMNGIAPNQVTIRRKITELIGDKATARFYDAWLANHCTRADIDSMAVWGFNSVRLAMHYNLFTLPVEQEPDSTKNTWIEKGFALTDSLLDWCRDARIYLILDLHAAPGGQGNDIPISDRDTSRPSLWQSPAAQNKTIALWKELARRYANEEWIGGYDLINEPNWPFEDPSSKNGCSEKNNRELKELLTAITREIRKEDTNHIIFIEGNCWANNYNGMFPLWDNNLVVSFHKYWNRNDEASIAQFLKIREEQQVPLWLGESGENSNAWYTDAISLVEKNNIGWAWWPLKKLGANNPLQVPAPEGYAKLLKYWRGEGPAPSREEAEATLMQLAKALRIENNKLHRGVIDAMFRQVRSGEVRPYVTRTLSQQVIIYAADYDEGRSGISYSDTESGEYWVATQKRTGWNRGGQYRNDGVDIGLCNDSLTNGYYVGWTEPGEWLEYTVDVPADGWYTLSLRAREARPDSLGVVSVLVNGKEMGKALALGTASAGAWQTVKGDAIRLARGRQQLRLLITRGNPELNYFSLSPVKKKKTKEHKAKNDDAQYRNATDEHR